jgi:CubicO group peptidase (beta-lactamase class C family)
MMIQMILLWMLSVVTGGCLFGYLFNKAYMDRYFLLVGRLMIGKSPQAEWYDSVEQVPGSSGPCLEVAALESLSVVPAALKSAREYAKSMDSDGFVVWHNGKVQEASYWHGYDRNRLIVSKSMAKMIVGLAIGRAIEQGHIKSVDQPVSDFIIEWKGTPKEHATIRNFLQNSSGLSRFTLSILPWSLSSRAYLSYHHEDILIHETKAEYEPGSEYDYSLITSDILAIVIERATQQRYADYIGNHILRPIGAQGGTVFVNRPGGLAHSGCGMMLPAESFIRMGILMAWDGMWDNKRILADGWVAETLKPSPANPKWGLHIWLGQPYQRRVRFFSERLQPIGTLHSEPYAADDIYLWDGSGNQAMWIVPSKQLVVLRFGPKPKPKYGQPGEWDNSRIPNTIIRGLKE